MTTFEFNFAVMKLDERAVKIMKEKLFHKRFKLKKKLYSKHQTLMANRSLKDKDHLIVIIIEKMDATKNCFTFK